ncbi:MAG: hypothetical protein GX057_03025 [Clostridiales bacterium]|nr:hypothetical protein [Clostridiales bacterium]
MRKFTLFLLVIVMLLAVSACNNGGSEDTTTSAPETTTDASGTTKAPETTKAQSSDTTTKPPEGTTTPETTAPSVQYGENEYGTLPDSELVAYKVLLPAQLPDGSPIENFVRPMCLDETFDSDGVGEHYMISGNSSPQAKFVTIQEGALYGTALNISAYGQSVDKRAEVEVMPLDPVSPVGAKGVLFWVDFSNTDIQTDTSKAYKYCASVTFNKNDFRANKDNNGSIGYYYQNGKWVETKNINACRMELPDQFMGWVYIPATSYIRTSDKSSIADDEGRFTDFALITNMRLYTDGYVYTDSPDKYIIFDEILFVY